MELLWLSAVGLAALAVVWVLAGLVPRRRPRDRDEGGPFFE